MPWKAFDFRGDKVWARVLDTGKPIVRNGLAEIRYKLGAVKSYKTARENLEELEVEEEILTDEAFGGAPVATPATQIRETPAQAADATTIVIHTDGACSGNPGPAGVGVHIVRPDRITEYSEFIGDGTNNVAELTAILRGIELLEPGEAGCIIHMYTDSGWSLGVLVGGWKAKKNVALIDKIKARLPEFPKLELLKVKGHAGASGNEEADELAVRAVRREETSKRERPR